VKVCFAGDVFLGGDLLNKKCKNVVEVEAFNKADVRIVNLEQPISDNDFVEDKCTFMLFAPTVTAVNHLANEGIFGNKVQQVGDVMYDTALFYKARAKPPADAIVVNLEPRSFALSTIHRAENTDNAERMKGILAGLASVSYPIVLPIHPRTRTRLAQMGLTMPSNVHVIDPVSYLEMVWLEMNCRLVITDSGGVQKEAYFHDKPCVTLRDETEMTELVELGVNQLVDEDPKRIAMGLSISVANTCFNNKDVYGTVQSGACVVHHLLEHKTHV
jgi:UDP-GlcNAc3NAcA epimerase